MKYIITENQYISLILRRRLDTLMDYVKKSYGYLYPCDYNREDFVYTVAWSVGNEFHEEGFTGINTLSDVRRWVEDNLSDELLKYWDENCRNKKKLKSTLFMESKLHNFIYEYLTNNYHPDYGWGPDFLYRKDIEKFSFHDFEVDDIKAYAYRGKGRNELLVRTWVADELTTLFGDSWKPVFAKWFEDNTSLPVGEVIVWDMI